MALLAIIRVRGSADVPPDVEATLKLLRLNKRYHAVIYPDTEGIRGMLKVVKDWVTWGEIDRETLKDLIRSRGRLCGGKPISEEALRKVFGVGSYDELADMLLSGKIMWHKIKDVKPVFRLHPPKGGFKGSVKRPHGAGGELGYRGGGINELIRRMI